jgi:hypothetical protein
LYLTSLRKVNFSYNREIQLNNLPHFLFNNKNISFLDLTYTSLQEDKFDHLLMALICPFLKLEHLKLNYNFLSDDKFNEIIRYLCLSKSKIKELDMESNLIMFLLEDPKELANYIN